MASFNPEQLVMNMMQQGAKTNPLFANLFSLAQQGKSQDIEAIAKNVCKENNIDFEKEFTNFKRNFGL
jgi:hypothetical protein